MRKLVLLALPCCVWAQCTFTVNPASVNAPASPDTTGQFTVTASAGTCARTAVSSDPSWLTISFGASGTGNGSIGYRIDSNPTPSGRTGSITVGNARFNVTQAAGNCEFNLSALGERVSSSAGTGSFRITTRCAWTASSNSAWLRVSTSAGTGDAAVSFAFDANTGADTRIGIITAGGRQFTVTQNGVGCNVRISSSAITVPAAGGAGSIDVTATCSWTATRSQTWIALTGATNGNANGTVAWRVDARTGNARRLGTINVQDQVFTITQEASESPRITSILNAASFLGGAIAPGEIVVVFGDRFGADPIALYEVSDGFFSTEVARTRLLFDDVPAPLIYSFTNQVSAIVPYSVAGKTRTQVVIEFDGKRSAAFPSDVAATAPGIFTQTATGGGAGAILNEDFTLNTPANPAGRGSIVQIYATGEGQTNPPGIDGKITVLPPPEPELAVQVFIGGAAAEILYRGGAPGIVAGMIQINARVPAATQQGDAVPIRILTGGRNSQGTATVSIQ